jgi:selenocysteine lyase/cysteine desulfurase
LFSGEFPANVTPWQRAAELFQLETAFIPMRRATEDEASFLDPLDAELRRGARLVAVSAVQFQTGLRMPLTEIAALCRRYGAELCVDAIQACGSLPVDVTALGIDYLVCGGHKWMMALDGAGFLYARPEAARALVPRTAGWLSHEDGAAFLFRGPGELRYDRQLKQGVPVFEGSSASTVGFAALEAALDPILDLGPNAIFAHITNYLDALESGLTERGIRTLRARQPGRRSGILSFVPPSEVKAIDLVMALRAHGVLASMPDGLVRFAPHFPNSQSEIGIVLGALDEALEDLSGRS